MTWGGVRAGIKTVSETIGKGIAKAVKGIESVFKNLSKVFETFIYGARALIKGFGSGASKLFKGIKGKIVEILAKVKRLIDDVLERLGSIGSTTKAVEERNFKTAFDAIPASIQLIGKGDNLANYASCIKKLDRYTDVIIHGNPNGFEVLHNGKWVSIDQRSLAAFIKKNGYDKGPIRLISCNTGKLPDGAAKNLANKLGVEVIAPSDTVWLWKNGNLTIGPDQFTNNGVWNRFLPGK